MQKTREYLALCGPLDRVSLWQITPPAPPLGGPTMEGSFDSSSDMKSLEKDFGKFIQIFHVTHFTPNLPIFLYPYKILQQGYILLYFK